MRILVILFLLTLTGCKDTHVSWDSEDIINSEEFSDLYKQCAVRNSGYPKITGLTFRDCLLSSYTISKEN